jgi:hypothetical protein
VTAPIPQPDEESLAYEATAVAAIVGPVAASVAAATAVAGVAVAGGTITGAAAVLLGRAVAQRLRDLTWSPRTPLLADRADGAVRLGVRTALDTMPARTRPDRVPVSSPDILPDIDSTIREKLSEAADIADNHPIASKADLDRVSGRANAGLAQARGSVRYAVNAGINSGTADVARAAGHNVLWVPERFACLHCLAYAGWVTEPDQEFPRGLTFDPTGPLRSFGLLLYPPLHPNCRCRLLVFNGRTGAPELDRSKVDPASRLASEAQRTVIYQWSDYASGAASRRAATALLDQGSALADSVERRARAALRRGKQVGRRKP